MKCATPRAVYARALRTTHGADSPSSGMRSRSSASSIGGEKRIGILRGGTAEGAIHHDPAMISGTSERTRANLAAQPQANRRIAGAEISAVAQHPQRRLPFRADRLSHVGAAAPCPPGVESAFGHAADSFALQRISRRLSAGRHSPELPLLLQW